MNLKKAELIQFSLFKSERNMFIYHIGDVRDGICNTINKIEPGTTVKSKMFHFWGKN